MEAAPVICPVCGELIIARPDLHGRALVIPVHPDRIYPTADCVAGAKPTAAYALLP